MAMIGSQAAPATQTATATSWLSKGLWATTTGKTVTAATIGVIAVGSVMTARHLHNSGSTPSSNTMQAAVPARGDNRREHNGRRSIVA